MTLLKNSNNEFLESVDGQNGTLTFTKDETKAKRYEGDWFSDNEKQWLDFHFGKKYGNQVTSLRTVYPSF